MTTKQFLKACDVNEELEGYKYLTALIKRRKQLLKEGVKLFNVNAELQHLAESEVKSVNTIRMNCITIINIIIDNMCYNTFINRYFDMQSVTLKRFICVAAASTDDDE